MLKSIKEYYELHSADRFDKLNEMDKFLDRSVTKTDIRRKRKSNNHVTESKFNLKILQQNYRLSVLAKLSFMKDKSY